ncbi:MAG: YkgJ family cysteine cluster protein [Candidatus Hydrogenedentota bacterium]|nr:MAG: YkgJ family cysteine cluster protein [Candidatus Hydrogenedentota bacterium]
MKKVKPRLSQEPWYATGLRFSCQPDCHKCCLREGIVELREGEGEDRRLAEALGLSLKAFRGKFTDKDDMNGRFMEDGPHGGCPLWRDGCRVYDVRPSQCRSYPFWPEILKSRRSWEKEGRFCPGIGTGRWYSRSEIAAILAGEGEATAERKEGVKRRVVGGEE